MYPGYELFDHTADLGLRVWAPSREGLLLPAAQALYAAIGELVANDRRVSAPLELEAPGAGLLLRDYLAQLLQWFETRSLLLTGVIVTEFNEHRLSAAVDLGELDLERSSLAREVKAVTYHELAVRTVPGGVAATIIVDI